MALPGLSALLMARRAPYCSIFLSDVLASMLNDFLGTPRKILRLFRFHYVIDFMALLLLAPFVPIFAVLPRDLGVHDRILQLEIVAIPVVATLLRWPLLRRMEHECRYLVQALLEERQPVAFRMIRLLRNKDGVRLLATNLVLAAWSILSLVWNCTRPPCVVYADSEAFWELEAAAIPCEAWCGICTVMVFTYAALSGSLVLAPEAISRFHVAFTPASGTGMPSNLFEWLPSTIYGAPQATDDERGLAPDLVGKTENQTSDEGPACAICLENFKEGERLRKLPCGHAFHAPCVDNWLQRMPTCPMRCPTNLWEAACMAREAANSQDQRQRSAPESNTGNAPLEPAC